MITTENTVRQIISVTDPNIVWEPDTYYAVTSNQVLYIQTGTSISTLSKVRNAVWELTEFNRIANYMQQDITITTNSGTTQTVSPSREYEYPVIVYTQDSNRIWRLNSNNDIWDLLAGEYTLIDNQTTQFPYNCIQLTEFYLHTMVPRLKKGVRYCTTDTHKIFVENEIPYNRDILTSVNVVDHFEDLSKAYVDTNYLAYVIDTDNYYRYNENTQQWDAQTDKEEAVSKLYIDKLLGSDYAEVALQSGDETPIKLSISNSRVLQANVDLELLSQQLLPVLGSYVFDIIQPVNSILCSTTLSTPEEVSQHYKSTLNVDTEWEPFAQGRVLAGVGQSTREYLVTEYGDSTSTTHTDVFNVKPDSTGGYGTQTQYLTPTQPLTVKSSQYTESTSLTGSVGNIAAQSSSTYLSSSGICSLGSAGVAYALGSDHTTSKYDKFIINATHRHKIKVSAVSTAVGPTDINLSNPESTKMYGNNAMPYQSVYYYKRIK